MLNELKNDSEVREPHAAHVFRGTMSDSSPSTASKTGEPPAGVTEIVKMDKTKDFR